MYLNCYTCIPRIFVLVITWSDGHNSVSISLENDELEKVLLWLNWTPNMSTTTEKCYQHILFLRTQHILLTYTFQPICYNWVKITRFLLNNLSLSGGIYINFCCEYFKKRNLIATHWQGKQVSQKRGQS